MSNPSKTSNASTHDVGADGNPPAPNSNENFKRIVILNAVKELVKQTDTPSASKK